MKKNLKILTTTVLSVGLLTTTFTAYPKTLSDTFTGQLPFDQNVQVAAEKLEPIQEAPQPAIPSEEAAVNSSNAPTKPPANTLTPRPRIQTSQASRGGQPSTTKSVAPSTASSSKATAIITTAKKYMGVKYVWGGTTPSGFDCSGYTQYVFAQHGINLPRVSRDQYKVGTSVSYENLRAGDLVFFSLDEDKVIDHVGIYIGNGQFINASSSKGVTIYTLGSYWKSHYIGAKRVL